MGGNMVILRSLFAVVLVATAAALPRLPTPTKSPAPTPTPTPGKVSFINMRIVGSGNTKVFDGQFSNAGGNVILETRSGGTHYCGYETNGGQLPGGAPAVALDTVAQKKHMQWDAKWDGENYAVTTIGTETTKQSSWSLYVNGNSSAGQPSCATSFNWGANEVLWIDDPSQYQHVLYLHPVAQNEVDTGKPFQVTVTDYITGKPVQGASIFGSSSNSTTDAGGHVTIELDDCGPYYLRAKQANSADSNVVYVVSDPYGRKRCV